MSDWNRQAERKCPSFPFENEEGLSTFDLNLIHNHRQRHLPFLKRNEKIPCTSKVKYF